MTRLFFFSFIIFILSCSSAVREGETVPVSANDSAMLGTMASADTNAHLVPLYVEAIRDFLHVMKEHDKSDYDTLYLLDRKMGPPDDFPKMELPGKVDGVNIKLLPFEVANGSYKSHYTKRCPAINLFGWIDSLKTEFMFITFFPEFAHQYDLHLYYAPKDSGTSPVLTSHLLEVLIYDAKGKASHFEVFENGKRGKDREVGK